MNPLLKTTLCTLMALLLSQFAGVSADEIKTETNNDEINTSFLPDVSELKKIFEKEMEEIGNPVVLSPECGILLYMAVADRRPHFGEKVVAYFRTAGKSLILAKFYRTPYSGRKHLAQWSFLALPDMDFSGDPREIGWIEFPRNPTKSELINSFLKKAGFAMNKRDEIVPSGSYDIVIIAYQNVGVFETLGLGNFDLFSLEITRKL